MVPTYLSIYLAKDALYGLCAASFASSWNQGLEVAIINKMI